jgi:hypothetical protein
MFGLSGTAIAGIAGAVIGGVSANSAAKKTAEGQKKAAQMSIDAQKDATKIDPRIEAMLYGTGGTTRQLKAGAIPTTEKIDGVTRQFYSDDDYETVTNKGLLGSAMDYLNKPQSAGLQAAGRAAESDLMNYYGMDQATLRSGIERLMGGQTAPQMSAASAGAPETAMGAYGTARTTALPTAYDVTNAGAATTNAATATAAPRMEAATGKAATVGSTSINAPSQNQIDLRGNFENFLNAESGANPFLTGAIQKGINQSKNAFQDLQTDATRNLTENVLGNIRGGAIASGGYGGSRQGIAELGALRDFNTQMSRAAERFGQGNTDAAVAAQAGQYGQDQANKLSAMMGLSGQQYGLASQQAQMAQQAALAVAQMAQQMQLANMANKQQAGQIDVGNQQQTNLFNAANQQQANLANTANQQQANLFNAGNANEAARTQYGGLLSTNQANTAAQNQFGMANLGNQQQANMFNASAANDMSRFNAGNQQQANQANLNAQMGTNQLNQAGLLSGMGALTDMSGRNYNMAQNYGNAEFNRAQQVSGLLQPYAGKGTPITVPQYQPMYTNNASNMLGGALLGQQLYNNWNTPQSGLRGDYSVAPLTNLNTTQGLNLLGNMPQWNFGKD